MLTRRLIAILALVAIAITPANAGPAKVAKAGFDLVKTFIEMGMTRTGKRQLDTRVKQPALRDFAEKVLEAIKEDEQLQELVKRDSQLQRLIRRNHVPSTDDLGKIFRRIEELTVCSPKRDCTPTIVVADNREVTFALECAGFTSVVKFPMTRTREARRSASQSLHVLFWGSMMDRPNAAELERYLALFPNGVFRELAQIRLANLPTRPGDLSPISQRPVNRRPTGTAEANLGAATTRSDPPEFEVNPQHSYTVGCDPWKFTVPITGGEARVTLFGTLSVDTKGQTKFSVRDGHMKFVVTRLSATPDSPTGSSAKVSGTPLASREALDTLFWHSIRDSTRPAEFLAYLMEFPNGVFRLQAYNRLAVLCTSTSGASGVGEVPPVCGLRTSGDPQIHVVRWSGPVSRVDSR